MTMTEHEFKVAGEVARVLMGSAFAKPEKWSRACVVFVEGSERVVSRAQHAGWLASRGAAASAKACLSRTVAPGHILAWSSKAGSGDASHGRFFDIDLVAAQREVAAGRFVQETKGEGNG